MSTEPPLTRKDFAALLAAKLNLPPKVVGKVLEAFINAAAGAVATGRRVELRPLGVFEVKVRGARTARNPHTGDTIEVPARSVAKWKTGIKIKRALKGQ
jgi:DNA-binding protein HU-beta